VTSKGSARNTCGRAFSRRCRAEAIASESGMSTPYYAAISIRTLVPYLVFCCACLLPGASEGNAQSANPAGATPAVADKNSAEMSSHDAPATFKAKVNLVLVPVVVRDNEGRAVGNLRQEDFQLFDKGKPQIISKFSVETSAGHVAKEPGSSEGNVTEKSEGQSAPLPAMPERFVAYLFDDVHLAFGDLARVRDAAHRHLASLGLTDRAAIFSTSGQTTLDFTDDRDKLHETLVRLQPRPVTGSRGTECPDVDYYTADLIQNKHDPQALQSAAMDAFACMNLDPAQRSSLQVAQQAANMAASREMMNGDHETRLSLSVVKEVVRRISAMPGLRSVILVSPGFFTPSDLVQDKTEIMDRAIRANVIISALDARGLYTVIPGGDASQASRTPVGAGPGSSLYKLDAARVQADVLAELAEGTGGTFFQNSNDLDAGLRRIATRPEYFYVLGFSPQNLKLDGSFHKLKVALKEASKVSLQARRGYYAPKRLDDPADTAKQEIEDALFSREEMHDIPVELHTQFFKSSDENAKLAVLVRVDVRQLRFRKTDGRNQDDLTIVSGLFDRNGNYIKGTEKRLEMRLRDATLQNRLGSGITVKTDFDVKPGTYLVRLVVRDAEGQLMSAQNGAVEIP
jgi:VWFA-related protein